MSSSLNKVCLLGNVGKDPESRAMNNGKKVVTFSLATSETWKDKNTGVKKDNTQWHNVVIFNEQIGNIADQYVRKGSKVYLEGAIQSRKWQDKDGNDRYVTEIVLNGFSSKLLLLGGGGGNSGEQKSPSKPLPATSNDGFDEDEIPF
jgi:single-strand DNA-binding protein